MIEKYDLIIKASSRDTFDATKLIGTKVSSSFPAREFICQKVEQINPTSARFYYYNVNCIRIGYPDEI